MKRYVINHITELRNVGGFHVTTFTYDMGDRRTEVNHPASGITSFTYDALGNVLTKQTANLCKGRQVHYLRLRLSASDGYQLPRPSGEQREVLHNRVNKKINEFQR